MRPLRRGRLTLVEVMVLLTIGLIVASIVVGRRGGIMAGSRRPLPLTRKAGGWTHSAEHRSGGSGIHWTLTYRGEPLPAETGPLLTPLGLLTNEPSRLGDTGSVLDVSRNARKIPETSSSVTVEILTAGYHPSDCMTKPRGMPPDWCCRPAGEPAGWIAPSILFGSRFRVEEEGAGKP